MIAEITRAASTPEVNMPAADRTRRHREAVTELFRLLEPVRSRWNEWEDKQWDIVRTPLARRFRAWRLRRARKRSTALAARR